MVKQQKVVTRGGVSGTGHSIHLILTFCTCGLWAPIWFLHWLLTRSKTVTKIPVQQQAPYPAAQYPPAPYPPQIPPGYPQQSWPPAPQQLPQQQYRPQPGQQWPPPPPR